MGWTLSEVRALGAEEHDELTAWLDAQRTPADPIAAELEAIAGGAGAEDGNVEEEISDLDGSDG